MQIFVYDDAAKLIGEYDDLGRARVEHVWLEERPIAVITYTYTGTSTTPATTTTSYVRDRSPRYTATDHECIETEALDLEECAVRRHVPE